ncbi:carboxymuconolactone decarboxylase family protein [Albimonas pacifica]|uniref:Alkylhydroperoxidase AhpD family core domain-containing protein n=1 Tax=Albimonas pacifica TaxID=1114924 RepID=A0A1I3E4N8_9RHOB|nr:carboxymuconolactone decarboxylase family protein [Albimonas pacifica]SFH93944.1 alkylhydroperoxidase AhpD family core domain-containing protein [Albimonas pacifica]
MLLDWISYLREGRRAGAKLAKANPRMVEGFQALSAGQNGNGALDARTRELIALAVAVTTRCDTCIAVHADRARQAGVTEAELADAMGTAVALNAGAAYSYAMRTMEAFEQLGAKDGAGTPAS